MNYPGEGAKHQQLADELHDCRDALEALQAEYDAYRRWARNEIDELSTFAGVSRKEGRRP